jgi:hypothetical protein
MRRSGTPTRRHWKLTLRLTQSVRSSDYLTGAEESYSAVGATRSASARGAEKSSIYKVTRIRVVTR